MGESLKKILKKIRQGAQPHVCGENFRDSRVVVMVAGSTPRVWGKLFLTR